MTKCFCFLMLILAYFSSVQASTGGWDGYVNPKSYIYDDEGNPVFVKVYVESSKCHRNADSPRLSEKEQILNLMIQEDKAGSFWAIPIKKKKSKEKEDDTEESTWECPMCGRTNPASRNTCQYSDCPLNRKGIREKYSFFSSKDL